MIQIKHTITHTIQEPEYKTMAGGVIKTKEVLVAPAKLVLVECKPEEALFWSYNKGDTPMLLVANMLAGIKTGYKPIFISETEKITHGDLFLHEGKIYKYHKGIIVITNEKVFKILALPEHFSPQQLQMIVDGKLKDGCTVLVECKQSTVTAWAGSNMIRKHGSGIFGIKLNPHITIYPVEEKMVPLSEVRIIAEKAAKQAAFYGWYTPERFKEWFEQNVK